MNACQFRPWEAPLYIDPPQWFMVAATVVSLISIYWLIGYLFGPLCRSFYTAGKQDAATKFFERLKPWVWVAFWPIQVGFILVMIAFVVGMMCFVIMGIINNIGEIALIIAGLAGFAIIAVLACGLWGVLINPKYFPRFKRWTRRIFLNPE